MVNLQPARTLLNVTWMMTWKNARLKHAAPESSPFRRTPTIASCSFTASSILREIGQVGIPQVRVFLQECHPLFQEFGPPKIAKRQHPGCTPNLADRKPNRIAGSICTTL